MDRRELEDKILAYLASSHSTTWGKSFTIAGGEAKDTLWECIGFIADTMEGVLND